MTDEDVSDLFSEVSDTSYISDIDNRPNSFNYDISNGSPIDTNMFNVVHYNINSITAEGRLEELIDTCKTLNVAVLCLTESKLDSTIPNNILKLDGYFEPIRRDREINGRYGGGCLIYISDTLTYKQRPDLQSEHYEHLWVDVKINNLIFAINCLYRPPEESNDDHDKFITVSTDILDRLQDYPCDNKFLVGDMNFGNCYCKDPELPHKPLDSAAPTLYAGYGYSQLIDIPTRITNNTMSLIDLFFVQSETLVTEHGTLPQIADHEGVIVCFSVNRIKKKSYRKLVHDYKNTDINGLLKFIKEYNFENNIFTSHIEQQAFLYTTVLKEAFDEFVPKKWVVIKPGSIPWCNRYTRLLMRKKNRNYRFFKKISVQHRNALNDINTTEETLTQLHNKKNKAHKNFKTASKESSKANLRVKNAFFNSVNSTMCNNEISAKKKFNILSKLLNNQKFSVIPPLLENGTTVNDPKKQSDILNSFFASKSTVPGSNDEPPDLPDKDINSYFSQINTSPIQISKTIRNCLKKSHLSHCGIPGKFLSLIATPISFSLSRLLNNHFENGLFPDIWKLSHITSIWKQKGLKSDKTNYRPISLLPTLSKICESVIHNGLLSHCIDNNLITHRQAAYLKGDSTINQLLYIIHKIRLSWTKGCITHGIFLDVRAAFDKVWHKGLIAKLKQNGVTGKVLELLTSYLTNRRQIVVVDGVKSKEKSVLAGVPQGSRLGPLLFILYINDITENIESDILVFADDTSLLCTAKDVNQTNEILNRDLAKISSWAQKWKVEFNAEKSKNIIFSRKHIEMSPPIWYNNEKIDRVYSIKHLGLNITHNLNWDKQIHETCMRANRKLAVLRRVKYLKRSTLDLLYKLTVRSIIDYGLVVYYQSLNITDKAKFDKIQYSAAKLVTGTLHYSNRDKLNFELGWETIQVRAEILGLSLFHKIHRNETRPLIQQCMPELDINWTSPRIEVKRKPFSFAPNYFSNSFFPFFTKKWNKLPKDIKILPTDEFKIKLRTDLKPVKYKHFKYGSKLGCSLLTQIRVGRSYLKSHSFSLGFTNSPACECNNLKCETPTHYLTQCTRFAEHRRTLFDQIEQFIPTIRRLPLKRQFEILVFGLEINNPEMNYTNLKIQIFTQNYILKTKRFSDPNNL